MKKLKLVVVLIPLIACFYLVIKSQNFLFSEEEFGELINEPSAISGQNTYTISTCEELQHINNDLSGYYTLLKDIDCSETVNWNNGKGFEPIGYWSTDVGGNYLFEGVLDGNGFTINHLTIKRPIEEDIGLFGFFGGEIRNLTIQNASIEGLDDVGVLVGDSHSGLISNTRTIGSLKCRDNCGGLVGELEFDAIIEDSSSFVSVEGEYYVGGLVGRSEENPLIQRSYAEGLVSGDRQVGGLIGKTINSTVKNSYTTGDVEGEQDIGGLVGWAEDTTIVSSSATGDIVATGIWAGGLIGDNRNTTIVSSFATGDVIGTNHVGGLVGESSDNATIEGSYAEGSVFGGELVGGFIGKAYNSTIKDSHAIGKTEGLFGVGGLVGGMGGETLLQKSYAKGNVSGELFVGGLVGWVENSTIEETYATGVINGDEQVGGLIGAANEDSLIKKSYAAGNVKGWKTTGGLIGYLYYSTVENSFAMGNVEGETRIGGLIGRGVGIVENSYANGWVEGLEYTGGLVGYNTGSISRSYYDKETSEQNAIGEGEGLTTMQMKAQNSFNSWDFTDIWTIQTGKNNEYPYLQFREPDIKKPEKVKNITETHTSSSVRLTWENPKGSNVDLVKIYRNGVELLPHGRIESYEDTNLSPNTTYVYQLIVVNGNSDQSEVVTKTVRTDGILTFSFEKSTVTIGTIPMNGSIQTRSFGPGRITVMDTRGVPSNYNVSVSSTGFYNDNINKALPISFVLKKRATVTQKSGMAPNSIASDENWVLNENEEIKLFSVLTSVNPSNYTIDFDDDAFELTVNTNHIELDPNNPANTAYRGVMTWSLVTGP